MGEVLMLARSESRDGYRVRVLAVHSSEGNDRPNIDDAAALRDASWWTGSSHAIADDDPGSLLTPAQGCVPYDRASWTLRSGNRWSENIELIGWAKWTRAEWLARPRLLENCARWLADRSKARGIPLVKLTPQQYRAGQSGVIGHHDHTVGYSDGTHWDPGPGFPFDVVLERAQQIANGTPTQEDDMDANQASQLQTVHDLLKSYLGPSIARQEERQLQFRQEALAEVAGLRAALAALTDDTDLTAEEIEAAVERGTAKALRENVVTVDVDVAPGARTA